MLSDPKSFFENREFSFTLANDVYVRFLSFADQKDMEKEIKVKCPYKIDIGAIYNYMYVLFIILGKFSFI